MAILLISTAPDEEARREVLRLQLAGKPAAEDTGLSRMARETECFRGAPWSPVEPACEPW